MAVRLLMLDSGAFSVWSQGATIDLDKYIEFCLAHPKVSYFVNLDVIPGVMNQKRTLTKESIEASCKAGWDNYRRMLSAGIPKAKIIPVYHQNDNIRWLERYMEYGSPYIGISPANDNTTPQKLQWMRTVRRYIFDSAGRPLCRTHGFAVTSYDLMKFWQWHSVDSASWKLTAAWGCVYLPQMTGGEYDYSKPPLVVAVSPMSPALQKRQAHVQSMSPGIRRRVMWWLESLKIPVGEHSVITESDGYKLNRESGESWYDKKARMVLRPSILGVANSFEARAIVNARFVKRANKVLPVDNIYFAGAPMPYPVEFRLNRRLLSYHEIGKTRKDGSANKYLLGHLERITDDV